MLLWSLRTGYRIQLLCACLLLVPAVSGFMSSERKLELRELARELWYHSFDKYMGQCGIGGDWSVPDLIG